MPKLTRAQAARLNGAKSRGPVTSQGKAISSRNAITHGLTCAPRVTLATESEPDFQRIYAAYIDKYQPIDQEELDAVTAYVSYRWRWFRSWGFETELANEQLHEIYEQLSDRKPGEPLIIPAGRSFAAFDRAFEGSRFFANLPNYEGRLRRGFAQSQTNLRRLIAERERKVQPAPAKRSETPAEWGETPAKRSETPAERSETPAEWGETPAKRSETPAKRDKKTNKNEPNPITSFRRKLSSILSGIRNSVSSVYEKYAKAPPSPATYRKHDAPSHQSKPVIYY